MAGPWPPKNAILRLVAGWWWWCGSAVSPPKNGRFLNYFRYLKAKML